MTYLWTGSKKFYESDYATLILCRDVYHCTPSQLAKEDSRIVNLHMAFIEAEQDVQAQNKANRSLPRHRGRR